MGRELARKAPSKAQKLILSALLALSCAGAAAAAAFVAEHAAAETAYAAVGWHRSGGGWWYGSGGSYAKGWAKVGGKWYRFNQSGYMQTGWLRDGGKWYYLGSDGATRTGWYKVGKKWYYSNASGAMQTGWVRKGSDWYYLKPSGAMATNWFKAGGKWYCANVSGVMLKNRWVGNYYLESNGAMATNRYIDTYKKEWVGANGKYRKSPYTRSFVPTAGNSFIKTDYFSFQVPAYWYGKVRIYTDDHAIIRVAPKDYPDQDLAILYAHPGNKLVDGNSGPTASVEQCVCSSGRICFFMSFFWDEKAYIDRNIYKIENFKRSQWETLVSLATGGAKDYSIAIHDRVDRYDNYYENVVKRGWRPYGAGERRTS